MWMCLDYKWLMMKFRLNFKYQNKIPIILKKVIKLFVK